MTHIKRVSLAEMLEETGMPALGYARPKEDQILLVDGLPKEKEKEILAHEADHIMRGEEGPGGLGNLIGSVAPIVGSFFGPVGTAVGALAGGLLSDKPGGGGRAAQTSAGGADAALAENRRQFDLSSLVNVLLNLPSINSGNITRSQLLSDMGISTPATDTGGILDLIGGGGGSNSMGNEPLITALSGLVAPGSSPTASSRLSKSIMGTPGAQFMVDETTNNALSRGAALGLREAGTTVQDINQDVSNRILFPLYQDRLNRLQSLSGAGTGTSGNLAANIGNLSMSSGALNSTLMQNAADTRASGMLGDSGEKNALANQLGGLAGDYLTKPGGALSKTGWLGSVFGGMMG